jgi:tRNA dimethylallyltransferase
MSDREELARRIDARFDAMMAAGALEEVRALAARKLDPNLPAMKAHGVPWLIRHLNGEITLAETRQSSTPSSKRAQYTKRQATWFRNQLPRTSPWVEPTNEGRLWRSRRPRAIESAVAPALAYKTT